MPLITDLGTLSLPLMVLGGPVSNYAATQAAKAQAERLGLSPKQVICTGDIVAYGADAEETTDLIRQWGIHVVRGNCEVSLANSAQDCGCGFDEGSACKAMSKGWYAHALATTRPDQAAWMGTLPPFLRGRIGGRSFVALHGAVTRDNRFLFANSPHSDFVEELNELSELTPLPDLIFAGHSGIPFSKRIGATQWVNAGTLGMPANDGTPDVWYCLIDEEDGQISVTWHRLPYDWQASQERMREAGLCEGYDTCLETGLWPSLDVLPDGERQQTGHPLAVSPVHMAACSI